MSLINTHAEIEQLANGQVQHTQYLKPVAYSRNGSLIRIANALGNSGDPALPIGVDELVQFRVRNRLAGNSPVLHFGKGQSRVRLTPLGTNNVDGVVSGNTVTFTEAWNNADLRLTIAGHRLQKDILLKAGHPNSFQFRIDEQVGLDPATLSTPDFRILPPVLVKGVQSIALNWLVSQQGGKTLLSVTLPAGDYAGWTLDPTLTLQPDGSSGLDAWLRNDVPDTNYSLNATFDIGEDGTWNMKSRVLIKFDLSSLPSSAVISSATLSLYCTVNNSANARTFRIYRQSRAWVEAQATWNSYSTGNAWQTAGGFGANDCEQTDIGSRAFTATETLNEFKNFTLTPTTKAGLDLGNGWLVKADTEVDDAYTFSSSDNATAANRPKLVIVYAMPGLILFRKKKI